MVASDQVFALNVNNEWQMHVLQAATELKKIDGTPRTSFAFFIY